ncbi:MAG: class I SAM-dependent methyltransferase [Chloroflexota bacterium]
MSDYLQLKMVDEQSTEQTTKTQEELQDQLAKVDAKLAEEYGGYAGYTTDASPYLVEIVGEEPETEVKRMLTQMVKPESKILDVGCGPGRSLCQFAPQVAEAWGYDEDEALLASAHLRVKVNGLENVTLIHGQIANESEVDQLPDSYFDIAFCESGPGINALVAQKLTDDAIFIQEIGGNYSSSQFQEIMGRVPLSFLAYGAGNNDQVLISEMAELDFVPFSVKNYFYNWYFHDADHLERYVINVPWELGDWRMGGPLHYDHERDRAALELYARYHMTDKGIRMQQHIRVFGWRREQFHAYPVGV